MSRLARLMPTVFRRTINLWDPTLTVFINNAYFDPLVKALSGGLIICHSCLPNTTYTISKENSDRFSVGYYSGAPVAGNTVLGFYDGGVTAMTRVSRTVNVGNVVNPYIVLYIARNGAGLGWQESWKLKLELGASATEFEPY